MQLHDRRKGARGGEFNSKYLFTMRAKDTTMTITWEAGFVNIFFSLFLFQFFYLTIARAMLSICLGHEKDRSLLMSGPVPFSYAPKQK